MTKTEAEHIVDAINQLSSTAERILDADDIQPEKAFSGVRHYLGNYYGAPENLPIVLDRKTVDYCRKHLKTAQDGYYTATEFFDIDLDPIQDLAEYLDDQGHDDEAELVWTVVDFVNEIRQWADRQSDPVQEQPYTRHQRQQQAGADSLSEEAFLALFATTTKPHKARLLLDHILEVSGEKNVHTYYGALAANSKSWFKVKEQDFASLLRNFLSVAGLDPALAANVRGTKLSAKALKRAQDKLDEIDRTRARR
ncbi:MAG: hypothetical protein IKX81_06095 [Firmicutes bacterium]|nr:hypothetical protein [Bacillota bacterium]